MRGGNFSEINRVIYDPLTGEPFPGNIIPTSRFDPVSKNIISMLYPEANATGTKATNGQTLNNYVINPVLQRQDNQFDLKLDHNVSGNNHAFARYSFQKTHRLLPATLPHADTIVGQFVFDNNPTSNCGGKLTGCSVVSTTGFDVASFLLGYASQKNRNLFDAKTYTEKRPEYALYVQDDVRASNKLTLNLGLRWDLFVPWVEVDNRQSNFDVTTGRFVVASPDAVMGGVTVGRYLQTYSKKDFGPRFGFAYDVTGSGKTVLRG